MVAREEAGSVSWEEPRKCGVDAVPVAPEVFPPPEEEPGRLAASEMQTIEGGGVMKSQEPKLCDWEEEESEWPVSL